MPALAVATALATSLAAPAFAATAGVAQAGQPALARAHNPDPWEPLNRKLFGISRVLDRALFRPVAVFYKRVLPRPVRSGLHNFITNLDEPVVFVNDVLQIRLRQAGTTVGRFAINTTVGVVGIFDVAGPNGLPHHDNGFGLTLGRYGAPLGPFVYVPLLGPSSVRDLVGSGVDIYSNPLSDVPHIRSRALEISQAVIGALDTRSRLDRTIADLNAQATDPYATQRSVYLQQAEADLHDGDVSVDKLPDIGGDGAASVPVPADAASAPVPAAPPPSATPDLAAPATPPVPAAPVSGTPTP